MKKISIIILVAIGVLAIAIGSFFVVSFIDLQDTASAAKIAAGVFVFIGTLVSIGFALFTNFLKNSLDEKRLLINEETEKRLNHETAIKAAELLRVASDSQSSSIESSGALFALVLLKKYDFALRLLEVLWSNNQVPSASAVWVVNQGLQSDNKDIQLLSSDILLENANKLPDGLGKLVWPSIMRRFRWPVTVKQASARCNIIRALLCALIEKRSDDWKMSTFYWMIGLLWTIFKNETDSDIKAISTLSIEKLINIIGDSETIQRDNGQIRISDMRAEITPQIKEARESLERIFKPLIKRIQDWVEEAKTYGFQDD